MTRWLLIDGNNLSWRNFYVFGHLTTNEVPTGVLYGILRDIVYLRDTLGADNRFVFCWDGPDNLRKTMRPDYKANRKTEDPEVQEARAELYRQIELLHTEYLPDLGYVNNFRATGYEADDLIARIAKDVLLGNAFHGADPDCATIVSTDKDLFQLLHPNVNIYNPATKRIYALADYHREWNLTPGDWPHVKAIAGCPTDNVAGLRGVGDKTAAAYVRGDLNKGAKYKTIAAATGQAVWRDNLKLVQLPLAGCPKFELQDDDVTAAKWRALEKRLGFRDLGYR